MCKLRDKLQVMKDKYNKENAVKEQIDKDIVGIKTDIHFTDKKIEICDKAVMMLTEVSLKAKQSITMFLEDLVTDALSYISEGQYKFEIDLDSTEKSSKCEFYIVEEIDGETSKQKPQDACGGGFIDIISTTLRYAYLNLYNNPTLMGPVILDEPGKMVSAEMSVRFGEFIKRLGDEFDRQTIIITHNDNLTNIADKVEEVVKAV
jgi:DNA repair exonuclease SbcCD ATPase subunit